MGHGCVNFCLLGQMEMTTLSRGPNSDFLLNMGLWLGQARYHDSIRESLRPGVNQTLICNKIKLDWVTVSHSGSGAEL